MCALEEGFRVSGGFDLVRRIHDFTGVPIFIMSYGSVVFARGVEAFVRDACDSGAVGLIIPDLMPGYDEGLFEVGRRAGIHIVPVVPPGVGEERLKQILAEQPSYLYASLRAGITGSRTEVDGEVISFLTRLRATGAKILAGFGIQTGEQVFALKDAADVLIVGSAIVRALGEGLEAGIPVYTAARNMVRELLGGSKPD